MMERVQEMGSEKDEQAEQAIITGTGQPAAAPGRAKLEIDADPRGRRPGRLWNYYCRAACYCRLRLLRGDSSIATIVGGGRVKGQHDRAGHWSGAV